MAKQKSVGVLLYRYNPELEVFIVHPSGKGNVNAAWSIHKGKMEKNETEEQTALRELFEETGIFGLTDLVSLDDIVYSSKSKKVVKCFCAKCPSDIKINCNWEIDKAEFFTPLKAKTLLHKDQAIFIDRLIRHLDS